MTRPSTALRAAALLLVLAGPSAAAAAPSEPLQQRVEAKLGEAGPGVRFGLVVADAAGRELVAVAPEGRFIPGSNIKMFTTAAAFATLPSLDAPDSAGGAAVRLEPAGRGLADVVLEGRGDARLSSAAGCVQDCLSALADAVAARTRRVRDVIGDDSLFPDQRWSPGMSWNNIPTRSGTAASALSLDDNELPLRVFATTPGAPPRLELLDYYEVHNRAVTVAAGPTELSFDRFPGSRLVRLEGRIAAGAEPEWLRLGIDDPAHYAAWRLKALLEERGVRVSGTVAVRHRPLRPADDPAVRNGAPAARPPEAATVLARLVPPPLAEDLAAISKASQNLHSELLLRRIGRQQGSGSIADGLAAVHAMLAAAGVPRTGYDVSDGSGMSSYNRIAPRAMVAFLRWAAAQPWGAAWRATLPIGGVDGTLDGRFKGSPLQGRIFAKTGTLNASNALSGFMIARSGRTLLFSAFANDVPGGVAATAAMDSALVLIAEEN
ncbi:MAG TPA: D-alanyl-D-alanine carboxypeptidase/D-alanyl-D-alanine-endopeptidase [Allosphingosinicella sp.]|jgi:D-alanyl-D-alanine carboxypeptidase/D-alanyl-D-alanine-endopeptidase (penicillin-binding protein 4)